MINISGINLYGTTEIAEEKGCKPITVRVAVRRLRKDKKLPPGRGRGFDDLFSDKQKRLIIDNIGKPKPRKDKYSERNK